MIRAITLVIGYIFMPFIWLGMTYGELLTGEWSSDVPSLWELWKGLWSHYKSGEPF